MDVIKYNGTNIPKRVNIVPWADVGDFIRPGDKMRNDARGSLEGFSKRVVKGSYVITSNIH